MSAGGAGPNTHTNTLADALQDGGLKKRGDKRSGTLIGEGRRVVAAPVLCGVAAFFFFF